MPPHSSLGEVLRLKVWSRFLIESSQPLPHHVASTPPNPLHHLLLSLSVNFSSFILLFFFSVCSSTVRPLIWMRETRKRDFFKSPEVLT